MSKAAIVIHGGAGAITRSAMSAEQEVEYRLSLEMILSTGQAILADGGSALDAVTEAVRLLEECPLFNAGRGAVFTSAETHELDASIMEGKSRQAGAVAGVWHIRNHILAARAVMEHSPHLLLIGEGAEIFARESTLEMVENSFFPHRNVWFSSGRRSRQMLCSLIIRHYLQHRKWVPSAQWHSTVAVIWPRLPQQVE
ncbi:MAG: Isoaspartyl peptidase [Candidatus Erwinia impunctatus]|nr:Isoaspartyl peptidase [Culicoides impunctatus]